ncbi:hypothetical protein NIIDMKKI_77600 [Mycobacterium kansasii]|uniref:ESX-1 secretion-associated protein EspG1 n=1 Tax=Mycobacterium kansasii TaxID=1768 RepID=A0A1V3WWC6_MYCKA|nr:ESX-1 secretion-associated protein EspG1 [Mycobacterium kansasii]BCI92554.1 hypothetical protein NIIDMKKI_77600 [Mycobacterium kansasii]
MTGPLATGRAGLVDDVVGVEVTIDGMLVLADRLHLVDFPVALGIRPNIPQDDLREIVWDQVRRDLTAQGVLDHNGYPHPTVASMVDTLSRPDRTLEARWWRRDVGGVMVRFVVCRKDDRHVIAVRNGDLLVLQLVAPQVGLAGMVTAVLGTADPASVEPLTGIASELAECTTAAQLTRYGLAPTAARIYTEIVSNPDSWVEIVASQRHPGARRRTPRQPPVFSTRRTAGWSHFPASSAVNCTAAFSRARRRTCSSRWTPWWSFSPRAPG